MVSTSLLRISFCAETVASCSAREARERSSELIMFCEEQGANPTVHCASSSRTKAGQPSPKLCPHTWDKMVCNSPLFIST